jgi:uncharacterized protein (DUF2147 family)
MKKWWISLALTCFTVVSAWAQQANDIAGVWLNEEKDAKIEVYREGDDFFGKIIWIEDFANKAEEDKVDSKNPDPQLRTRSKMGLVILHDLKFDDDEWSDGEIYDARSGKMYSLTATMDGMDVLNLRGYVGMSLFGKTTSWTRVE